MRNRIMHWMNDHTTLAVVLLCAVGYALHLLYEYRVDHWPKPLLALIVFTGAGVAGWAIDLVFTKSEEAAGEID